MIFKSYMQISQLWIRVSLSTTEILLLRILIQSDLTQLLKWGCITVLGNVMAKNIRTPWMLWELLVPEDLIKNCLPLSIVRKLITSMLLLTSLSLTLACSQIGLTQRPIKKHCKSIFQRASAHYYVRTPPLLISLEIQAVGAEQRENICCLAHPAFF